MQGRAPSRLYYILTTIGGHVVKLEEVELIRGEVPRQRVVHLRSGLVMKERSVR